MTEQGPEQGQGPAPVPLPGEPNVHSGGKQEPGGVIPPYEGRQTTGESQEELAEDAQKQGPGLVAGPREVSEAEREGLSVTVGDSINTQGNEGMLGKSEASQRSDRMDVGIGDNP